MSFAATTSARRHLRPRFWIEIQGIEPVFVEATIAPTDVVDDRTQLVVVQHEGLVVGESRLDFESLAESGASLTVRLRDTSARLLRALFASRTRHVTKLADNLARGTALTGGGGDELEVADNAVLATSGTLYTGAETFTWTGKNGATTLTGVTRALYGSRANDHFGGVDDGGGVFLVPPAWIGRRVSLRAIYLDAAGAPIHAGASDIATLGTFRLEARPQFLGGDAWELQCGALHEAYANARVYIGQRDASGVAAGVGSGLIDTGVITLDASEAFLFAVGDAETRVRVDLADGTTMLPVLTDADNSSATIGRNTGPIADASGGDGSFFRGAFVSEIASLRHVAYLTGDATRILLTLLLSRLGDGGNDADYDVLPGALRTGFGREEWRFGAALLAADVDIDAFEAFIGDGPSWTLLLDEEMAVAALLTEWCRCVRAFWHVDSMGRLTATRLRDKSTAGASATPLTTLDDDDLLDTEDERTDGEEGPVATSVRLSANWDPISGQYLAVIDVTDAELAALYSEHQRSVEVESKMLSVDARSYAAGLNLAGTLVRANPMSHIDLVAFARRMMVVSTRPRVFLQHRFGWEAALLEVGDTVRVVNPRVPDLATGTVSDDCLVVGKQLDLESNVVTLRLLLLDRGWRVAPCALVSSWNAGTLTATVFAADLTGANPGNHFAAGWDIEMLDVSADPHTVAGLTIASVTATTITFTGAPSFTPAIGDIILPTPQTGGAAATSGLSPEDFVFQVPAAGTLGVADFEDPRWS